MSLPREIIPGATYMITRRCTQRQFLLKPSALTNQIFQYCLAVAAERTGVIVHAVCALSNHYHAIVTDPNGRLPEFYGWLHEFVGKALNTRLRPAPRFIVSTAAPSPNYPRCGLSGDAIGCQLSLS